MNILISSCHHRYVYKKLDIKHCHYCKKPCKSFLGTEEDVTRYPKDVK